MADRPLLVSIPAPLTNRAAMANAMLRGDWTMPGSCEIRGPTLAEAEAWAARKSAELEILVRYEVTPEGREALSLPDSTGSC